MQLGVGVKYRTIPPADNQEATWVRFPLEGLLVYRGARGFGAGVGAVVHLGNELRASGEVLDGSVAFRSTPGLLLHAEYRAQPNILLDLRYTALRYRPEGGGGSVGASSLGAGVSMAFGARSRTPRGTPPPRS